MDVRRQHLQERLPAVVGLQRRAALLALAERVVAPQLHDRAEVADVDGERPEQVAQVLLLHGRALLRVEAHHLGQPARVDVVGPLLDDQSIPPMHRYLTSSHSSMPYLEPSRPMPDSLTPPKGATSVEITPVLMPRIPYSSASDTRHTRPTSRA